jgi:hypothetical protein
MFYTKSYVIGIYGNLFWVFVGFVRAMYEDFVMGNMINGGVFDLLYLALMIGGSIVGFVFMMFMCTWIVQGVCKVLDWVFHPVDSLKSLWVLVWK